MSRFSGSIAAELVRVARDTTADVSHRGVADLEPPVIQHMDTEIKLPRQTLRGPKPVDEGRAMKIYFDGRCVKKKGAGGMIVFNHEGQQVHGEAWYFGDSASTNNEAEAESLLRAM